ncbi:MAG: hypothetical protein LBM56_03000 [Burkholderiaceae bacterium]|jgi:hypothetical protein|nr:hypothetical protein [Burkholderiaceae bacterium]
MRVGSGYASTMLYSLYGRQGMRADQAGRGEAENRVPGMAFASQEGKAEAAAAPGIKEVGAAQSSSGTDNRTGQKADQTADTKNGRKSTRGTDAEADPRISAEIAQLKQIEQEVIAHEAAHKAVGGRYASAASYSYTTGPDGQKYITGGEVSISTPATSDPEEVLRMAELVRRAALAPANPSSQDISVAARAAQKAVTARADIAAVSREEVTGAREESDDGKKADGTDAVGGQNTTDNAAAAVPDVQGGMAQAADIAKNRKAADAYTSFSDMNGTSGSGRIIAVG